MLSFQSVHGAEPLWNVSTNSSATSCGQRLNWSGFDDVEVRYIGWDGPEDNDEESDAGDKQVDDGNQEDTAKIY